MNTQEHILQCLSEECSEVSKKVSKALRFGLDDINPANGNTNRLEIAQELNDLLAVVEMLVEDYKVLDKKVILNNKATDANIEKVKRYMEYARKTKALKD